MKWVQGLAPVSAEGFYVAGVNNTRVTNSYGFHFYELVQRVVDSVEQILVVIYCDSQSTIYTYSLVIIGGIMNELGNEL